MPITNFGFASSPTNVYGAFLATMEYLPTRYAMSFTGPDSGWVVGLPGSTARHQPEADDERRRDVDRAEPPGASYYGDELLRRGLRRRHQWLDRGRLQHRHRERPTAARRGLRTTGLPANHYWYSLDFINSQTGWACGMYGDREDHRWRPELGKRLHRPAARSAPSSSSTPATAGPAATASCSTRPTAGARGATR